ncbi:hypothetical protein AgCh_013670 [Apium graveolens]
MESECKISIHALSGSSSANALKLIGEAGTHHISILVDSGCTHNLIDVDVASKFQCNVKPIRRMIDHTITESQVVCDTICKDFKWDMQGYSSQTEMRVIPMMGYDAIWGMRWLEDIIPVSFDFKNKYFTLGHNGEKIRL